jgi:hypothetical protein
MHIPLLYFTLYIMPFPVSQLNKTNKPNARCAQMFKQLNMNLQEIFVKTQIPTVTLAKTMNVHALKKFALAGSRTPLAIGDYHGKAKQMLAKIPSFRAQQELVMHLVYAISSSGAANYSCSPHDFGLTNSNQTHTSHSVQR